MKQKAPLLIYHHLLLFNQVSKIITHKDGSISVFTNIHDWNNPNAKEYRFSMPILYKPSKHAYYTDELDLAEQEHKDSCDINKMIIAAQRGYTIRGSQAPLTYGYDDTTLDGVTYRIQKQQLEEDLTSISKTHEFSEEELKSIPESIKNKFKFKTKQKAKNDELNDEKKPNLNKNLKSNNDSKKSDAGKPAPNSQPQAGASSEAEGDA